MVVSIQLLDTSTRQLLYETDTDFVFFYHTCGWWITLAILPMIFDHWCCPSVLLETKRRQLSSCAISTLHVTAAVTYALFDDRNVASPYFAFGTAYFLYDMIDTWVVNDQLRHSVCSKRLEAWFKCLVFTAHHLMALLLLQVYRLAPTCHHIASSMLLAEVAVDTINFNHYLRLTDKDWPVARFVNATLGVITFVYFRLCRWSIAYQLDTQPGADCVLTGSTDSWQRTLVWYGWHGLFALQFLFTAQVINMWRKAWTSFHADTSDATRPKKQS